MDATTTTTTQQVSSLRMSSPRLPLVVSQAALEFDMAAKGEMVDFKAARCLGEFLRISFDNPTVAITEKKGFDVDTVGLVGRALNDSSWNGGAETVSDVVEKAWQIAGSIDKNSDKVTFEHLRSFCIAFGNTIITHRESMQDSAYDNPYRR